MHSFFKPEILVYVNEGEDGTLNYLEAERIAHIYSPSNRNGAFSAHCVVLES